MDLAVLDQFLINMMPIKMENWTQLNLKKHCLHLGKFRSIFVTLFRFFPKQVDLKALHKFYDTDGDGNISYNEFVNALADQKMNQRKLNMVEKTWATLDASRAGELTGQQLCDCMKDKSSPQKILDMFPGTTGSNMEGKVSFDEFLQYYREVATYIPNDEYFMRAIEGQWEGVSEDIEASVNRTRVMHIVKLMRQRLTTISNNKQEEYVLRDIFRTFDLDKSGSITLTELAGMMSKLNVACKEDELLAVMKELDTNMTGTLEFEEFYTFMIVDPWK